MLLTSVFDLTSKRDIHCTGQSCLIQEENVPKLNIYPFPRLQPHPFILCDHRECIRLFPNFDVFCFKSLSRIRHLSVQYGCIFLRVLQSPQGKNTQQYYTLKCLISYLLSNCFDSEFCNSLPCLTYPRQLQLIQFNIIAISIVPDKIIYKYIYIYISTM